MIEIATGGQALLGRLESQLARLRQVHTDLEGMLTDARRPPEPGWRGPARRAYDAATALLATSCERAADEVGSAIAHTARAVQALSARTERADVR